MNIIQDRIGTVFIPVKDIERSRDWYADLLNLNNKYEILFGHICTIPLNNGTNIVLDSKIYDENFIGNYPLFHLNTEDIENAYSYALSKNLQIITEIQHNHYFSIKDIDGNIIMICKC